MANKNLNAAKAAKNDEFYTQMNDIAKELYHYRHHFVGKKIFLNCDDHRKSNFWQYFELNFDELQLEKLTATHYDPEEPTYKIEMTRGVDINGDGQMDEHDVVETPLLGNGDFRSAECIELLEEADIVITNPPFSLWREYIAQLMEYGKKFIILGSQNAVKYKEVFPLFQEDKIWIGFNYGAMSFVVPETYDKKKDLGDDGVWRTKLGNICWFTNLDIDKRHDKMTLWKDYADEPDDYPRYVNYDAIEVGKVNEIPRDYVPCWFECPHADQCEYAKGEGDDALAALCEITGGGGGITQTKCSGKMGVPITFLNDYSPDQFKILGINWSLLENAELSDKIRENHETARRLNFYLPIPDGRGNNYSRLYDRIVIRRTPPKESQ